MEEGLAEPLKARDLSLSLSLACATPRRLSRVKGWWREGWADVASDLERLSGSAECSRHLAPRRMWSANLEHDQSLCRRALFAKAGDQSVSLIAPSAIHRCR